MQAVAVSKLWCHRLFEAGRDGMLLLDYDEGRIVDVTPDLLDLLGLTREDLLGKTLSDVGYARAAAASTLNFETLKRSGHVRYGDLPLETKDRRRLATEFAGHVCRIGDKKMILCHVRDVTARQQIGLDARRMGQLAAIGQFTSGIAHELKTPLFILTGHLQLIREKLALRKYENLEGDLTNVHAAIQRMDHVISQFISVAKPHPSSVQRCSVQGILESVLEFLDHELMRNRIRVLRAWASKVPDTWSDPWQLEQVFINLIANAIHAMSAAHGEGTLILRTACAGSTIEVSIQDDGSGISAEHQAQLFQPFFTTKAGEQHGTGLGLWMVLNTLDLLKGSLAYETEVDRGTTFTVTIPIVAKPKDAAVILVSDP